MSIEKSSTGLQVIDNTMAKSQVTAQGSLGTSSGRAVERNSTVKDRHLEKVNILGLEGREDR